MATRRVKLSKELKEAIADLSNKEKDKLIFRLLPANPDLAKKLSFELLEGGDTMEIHRNELAEEIKVAFGRGDNYYSPGYLLLDFRSCNGDISRHVKTTKDKYGEIALNLLMLNAGLAPVREKIAEAPRGHVHPQDEPSYFLPPKEKAGPQINGNRLLTFLSQEQLNLTSASA